MLDIDLQLFLFILVFKWFDFYVILLSSTEETKVNLLNQFDEKKSNFKAIS